MLAETIDILTLLYLRKSFDYDGTHFHLKLTRLAEQYYPPRPVQQPRIPLWVEGLWDKTAAEAAEWIRKGPPALREGLL
jgi:alkanesulfonate monooxygenase SsuD/methylene tetrahydromethanopterin reductase-like flavin-dependent oxidoreductase (luciferase family)